MPIYSENAGRGAGAAELPKGGGFMWLLMLGEIGGFTVLFAGC